MFTVITGSATLRVLNVSENDIGDEGMAIISEALQHNKSLTMLGLILCGLSVKGTVAIVWIKRDSVKGRIRNNRISNFL